MEERNLNYSFSENVRNQIDQIREKIMKMADSIWKEDKNAILTNISNELLAKERRRDILIEKREELKPKIQENKIIAELSADIQQEKA